MRCCRILSSTLSSVHQTVTESTTKNCTVLRSTYKEHSPISSGVQGPRRITAVAPKAPHIRLNSNFDVILITIRENLSRKCIAISLIDPWQITNTEKKDERRLEVVGVCSWRC
jgi:hypothetical protein